MNGPGTGLPLPPMNASLPAATTEAMTVSTFAGRPAERQSRPPRSRLRLVALLCMSWQDFPVAGTVSHAESGRGIDEGRKVMSARELDAELARIDQARDAVAGTLVERTAIRDIQHPAYRHLEQAMRQLARLDQAGARLIRETLVGRSGPQALAMVSSLPYVDIQPGREPETPRHRLVAALVTLDRLLPDVLLFPRHVIDQTYAWDGWLEAIRPRRTKDGKTVRSGADAKALQERDRYVLELSQTGMSQKDIGQRLGLSQQLVSRIVNRATAESEWFVDPDTGRRYRDVTDTVLGGNGSLAA